MSWLHSPKKFIKFLLIFVLATAFLLFLLPNSYAKITTKKTDANADDHTSAPAVRKTETSEFNTTWDHDQNPWVIAKSIYNSTNSNQLDFLQRLTTYTTEGHDYDTLYNTQPSGAAEQSVTIILPIYSKDALSKLDVISSWTSDVDYQISVICSSQLKAQIDEKLEDQQVKITVIDRSTITTSASSSTFALGTAGASIWLQLLNQNDIDTDYVYIMDESTPLTASSLNELDYLFRVNQLDDYKNAFIGTRALVLAPNQETATDNFCLPVNSHLPNDISQPADMLLGAWLLNRSWLPYVMTDMSLDALKLPLGYYLSLNLNNRLSIPTIALPLPPDAQQTSSNKLLCEKAQEQWISNAEWRSLVTKNRFPTALQYRFLSEPGVLVVAQGAKQLISLYPVLCRFKKYPAHLAIMGSDIDGDTVKNALLETNCHDNVQVHDFSQMREHTEDASIGMLVKTIRPRIMIQIKSNDAMYYALQAMAKTHQVTEIGLPEKEVVHALWIPDLSLDALTYWNTISIKLVVITDRRPHSLSRLLQSAAKSIYVGDQVDLMIHMEQSADRVTRMLVNSFLWRQGQKMIRHRIRKGGLMPAIVESWYPSNNDEYAVLLEDDIEVSPLFYVWSKYAILKYRYSGNSEAYRLMYGISLYAPRNLELPPAGRVTFDPNSVLLPAGYPEHIPYASQVPCSWGGVYFPEHWREFHTYLVRRLEDLNLPKDHQQRLISVPGSRSDKWKKSWKKYFIELVYLRTYLMLYPNFQEFEAFSTNHVEFGTHVKSEKRQSVIGTFMVPLMQRDTILSQLPNSSLPMFEDLPVLDLWGQLQTVDGLEAIASKYHKHVSTCPRTYGTFDPLEFFCVVDGPPDPLQQFPMSPKKPKPPVLIKDAVQPIQYNYVYDYTEEQEEQARNDMLEFGPKPIDVAQLPTVEERFSIKDDEMLDLENDLDTLNRLYLKLNPEHLEFLEDEKMEMGDEEDDNVEEDDEDLENEEVDM
ncbi:uncharacterized protein ATC70_006029 [Mucor velutinosus]|uniref:Uncharacterized protein n=1 Tax=Mucor velutinosus TaxID=708070 RepID=A0AAN7DAQ7_9FUNG|nr:hypothetical protein ATC70_006029 [Mucor velutinosus]